jgi:hypothetical protein
MTPEQNAERKAVITAARETLMRTDPAKRASEQKLAEVVLALNAEKRLAEPQHRQ